jgi:Domian of unknown function (DUF4952)
MIQLLRQIPIILLLTLVWQLPAIDRAHTPPLCENFLAKWDKQTSQLHFTGCKYQAHIQGERVAAIYTVKGTEAKVVESFLMSHFQMAPLKFICCGWEPTSLPGSTRRYGTYRVQSGYYYEIAMGSGETLERNWQRISTFQVSVTKYMRDV